MRFVAALTLTLIAAGALAQVPQSVIYYGDEQGIMGDTANGIGSTGDAMKNSYHTCSNSGVAYTGDFSVGGNTFLRQPAQLPYRESSRISVTTDLPDMDLDCDSG